MSAPVIPLDAIDRRIVLATQAGLPLVREPFRAVADTLGMDAAEVMARLRRMHEAGAIRRIAAVPNHYRLGYVANGMSVWDVADDRIAALGPLVGALECVTHCYRRPRHLPTWPYNLFAMVHGRSRAEVAGKVGAIAELLGAACRGHDILYSSRILKKTGMRFVT
jgi:DNA-binding Lrp family transcriptional regulator